MTLLPQDCPNILAPSLLEHGIWVKCQPLSFSKEGNWKAGSGSERAGGHTTSKGSFCFCLPVEPMPDHSPWHQRLLILRINAMWLLIFHPLTCCQPSEERPTWPKAWSYEWSKQEGSKTTTLTGCLSTGASSGTSCPDTLVFSLKDGGGW